MVGGGRSGKIINIASVYACYGPPDFAHYPSAKAGLLGLDDFGGDGTPFRGADGGYTQQKIKKRTHGDS